jgi:hypothetical protein
MQKGTFIFEVTRIEISFIVVICKYIPLTFYPSSSSVYIVLIGVCGYETTIDKQTDYVVNNSKPYATGNSSKLCRPKGYVMTGLKKRRQKYSSV